MLAVKPITSSNRIRSRFVFGLLAVGAIILISILLNLISPTSQLNLDGVFIPSNLVDQTQVVYKAIKNSNTTQTVEFICGEKNRLLLREKISAAENIDFDKADDRLIKIWSDFNLQSNNVSCKTFPEILDAAYLLDRLSLANPKVPVQTLATQLFTQNLNWHVQALCVYGHDSNGKFIVSGRPGNCGTVDIKSNTPSPARSNLKVSFEPLLQLAKYRKQNITAANSNELVLTINPDLQLLASSIGKCSEFSQLCSPEMYALLKQTSDLTFTIFDANTGSVLAVGCHGKSCKLIANSQLGLLAGANIESPPASTEKLLFSYSFLQNRSVNPNELQLQIKTSGEFPGKASKRNEWWERSAICNNNGERSTCAVPNTVVQFAKDIGLNGQCSNAANRQCGTSDLLGPLGLSQFSPVNGRILVSANKDGPFLDEKLIKGPFMQWADYDNIREGKTPAGNLKPLESTSLVIQSVIGAGNNRITSYGLATIVSSIHQIANFSAIKNPTLFENKERSIVRFNGQNNAQIILKGMQKVVMPAEKNWAGDGTASKAFIQAFGKPCNVDCPIYGKTGTVSSKDPAYAGNTLFGALIKTNQLQQFVGKSTLSEPTSTLAIGVIANPLTPNTGHIASKFGMLLIKEVIKTDGL